MVDAENLPGYPLQPQRHHHLVRSVTITTGLRCWTGKGLCRCVPAMARAAAVIGD